MTLASMPCDPPPACPVSPLLPLRALPQGARRPHRASASLRLPNTARGR